MAPSRRALLLTVLAAVSAGCAGTPSGVQGEMENRRARIAALREKVRANEAKLEGAFSASGAAESSAGVSGMPCAAVMAESGAAMRTGRYLRFTFPGASAGMSVTLSNPRKSGTVRVAEGRCGGGAQ